MKKLGLLLSFLMLNTFTFGWGGEDFVHNSLQARTTVTAAETNIGSPINAQGYNNITFYFDYVDGDETSFDVKIYFLPGKGNMLTAVHDGGDGAATLEDATYDFLTNGVIIGGTVWNITDGSKGEITAITATVVTATLAGGTQNDFDDGEICIMTADDHQYGVWSSGGTNTFTAHTFRVGNNATAKSYIPLDCSGMDFVMITGDSTAGTPTGTVQVSYTASK